MKRSITANYFKLLLVAILWLTNGSINDINAQSTGTWKVESFSGDTPDRRHESGFVKLNGKFYLIGGRGTKRVQVYDPNTKKWSNTNTFTNDIHHFQAVAHNGKIYIIGALEGGFPSENPVNKILIYDPVADQLTEGASIPNNRLRGSAGVAIYNNKFYIVSGNRNGHRAFLDGTNTPSHVTWFDEYNPANNQWKTLPNAPRARDHFFVAVADDKLYVLAGRRSSQEVQGVGTFRDLEEITDVYDFKLGRWLNSNERPDNIPTARAGASVAVYGSEILVIGGETVNDPSTLSQTEALDIGTGAWRALAEMNTGRHGTAAIVNGNKIYLAAGSDARGNSEIKPEEDFVEFLTMPNINPTPSPCGSLPTGWTSRDVGGVGASGESCFDSNNNEFTLRGAGENIGLNKDEFQFAYQNLDCDAEIVAEIKSLESGFRDAKVGVMIRDGFGNSDKMAAMLFKGNGNAIFLTRSTVGGSSNVDSKGGVNLPRYVRVSRVGNVFRGYISANGEDWELIGSQTLSLSQNIQVGLALTSHENSTLIDATFANVRINCSRDPGPQPVCGALPNGWTSTDVGGVGASGESCFNSNNNEFTLRGAGENIGLRKDEFQFAYQTLDCDAEIIARISSLNGNFPDAKLGVMIRDGFGDDDKMVAMLLRANNRAIFLTRENVGASTGVESKGGVSVPRFVRLVREGNVFSGYISSNGTSWELIGSKTVLLSQRVQVGLALTSHENGDLATATFTNVEVKCNDGGGNPNPNPTCGTLPSNWSSRDVGGVGLAGESCFDSNTNEYTLKASGENIGLNKDEFQFAYQTLDCDGEIIAQIKSLEGGLPDAKVGVMIRDGFTNSDKMVAALYKGNGRGIFLGRTTAGATVDIRSRGGVTIPRYFRLRRTGDLFEGFISADGVDWDLLGSQTIQMNQSVQVGLAFTSHEDDRLATATFANVEVKCNGDNNPNPDPTCGALPNNWLSRDVGGVGTAGESCFNNGNNEFTLRGAGENIGLDKDEFQFAYQLQSCDAEIIARISSLNGNFPDAKVGVMMRDGFTNSDKMAAMLIRADGRAIFLSRTTPGARVNIEREEGQGIPRYVRIVRTGNLFEGYISSNGTTWTLIGSDNISMNAEIAVGLALTSHENDLRVRATFDNVSINCNSAAQAGADFEGDDENDDDNENAETAITLLAFPNHVNQAQLRVNVSRTIDNQVVFFRVLDRLGRFLGQKEVRLSQPSKQLVLDLSDFSLEPGVFYLDIYGKDLVSKPIRLVKE